jgi:putative membrane protein
MANKLNIITGVAALALVFGAGPAFAQYGGNGGTSPQTGPQTGQQTGRQPNSTTSDSSQTATADNKSSADETFAKKAAAGGMAEVKLGQLAEERGTNPAVKNFGRRMVQDHSKANNELKNTTSRENIELPADMDKSDQATYDRLSKLSGDAFDKAYARDMVKDHSKDVSEFQKEAKNGRDENIKNFAAQTLPTLQSHLNQARQMEEAVNQSSNSNSNSGNGTGYGNSGNSGNTYPTNNRTNPGTTSGPGTSGTQSPSR